MALDIKICGLKTDKALAAAVAGGASHVGFIFFAKSPRYVEPAEAGRLREAARGKAIAVAVSVDASDAFLDEIVEKMQPDMLQLHGSETPERVAEVKARHGLPVMKALPLSEAADLERIKPFIGVADRFLFDAKPPKGSELPGATASPSTGAFSPALTPASITCFPVGSTPPTSAMPFGLPTRPE